MQLGFQPFWRLVWLAWTWQKKCQSDVPRLGGGDCKGGGLLGGGKVGHYFVNTAVSACDEQEGTLWLTRSVRALCMKLIQVVQGGGGSSCVPLGHRYTVIAPQTSAECCCELTAELRSSHVSWGVW